MDPSTVVKSLDAASSRDPRLLTSTLRELYVSNPTLEVLQVIERWKEDHSDLFAGRSGHVLPHHYD